MATKSANAKKISSEIDPFTSCLVSTVAEPANDVGFAYSSTEANPIAPNSRALDGVLRFLDLAIATVALVMLFPLLLTLALAVRLDSGGPSLFRQRRFGKGKEPFYIMKFRTMTVMEDGPSIVQVAANDDRVTRLGRFLRRSSLDELPQLINVIGGSMSLVGPRPHAMVHDLEFAARYTQYNRRFYVKPGITGLAQVRDLRGPTQDDASLKGRVASDLEYVHNRSVFLYLKILLSTPFAVWFHKNAH